MGFSPALQETYFTGLVITGHTKFCIQFFYKNGDGFLVAKIHPGYLLFHPGAGTQFELSMWERPVYEFVSDVVRGYLWGVGGTGNADSNNPKG